MTKKLQSENIKAEKLLEVSFFKLLIKKKKPERLTCLTLSFQGEGNFNIDKMTLPLS